MWFTHRCFGLRHATSTEIKQAGPPEGAAHLRHSACLTPRASRRIDPATSFAERPPAVPRPTELTLGATDVHDIRYMNLKLNFNCNLRFQIAISICNWNWMLGKFWQIHIKAKGVFNLAYGLHFFPIQFHLQNEIEIWKKCNPYARLRATSHKS